MYALVMKTGAKYKENVLRTLSLIEHHAKGNKRGSTISVFNTKDFDLAPENAYVILKDFSSEFGDYFTLVNVYDAVNHEHWIKIPPQQGYTEHRPFAEIKLHSVFKEFKKAVVAELNRLAGDTRIEIIVSVKDGIYCPDDPKLNYPLRLKNGTNGRLEIMKLLARKKSPQTSGMIVKGVYPERKRNFVEKEIREINRLFKEKTGLHHKLIDRNTTNGYFMNNEEYRIVFK